MKRRVMIAKALAHEPEILFLDEPTAGVDVELRRDMWEMVRKLRARGVTIILTTHYIEEAQEMADRVGVIRKGDLFLVDDKDALMQKMGKKRVVFSLNKPLDEIPATLADWPVTLENDGRSLVLVRDATTSTDASLEKSGVSGNETGTANNWGALFAALADVDVQCVDITSIERSLEDIFVSLVHA